jgi:hypothetical protein
LPTASTKSSLSTGLVRKSTAPDFIAATLEGTSPPRQEDDWPALSQTGQFLLQLQATHVGHE